MEEKKNYPFEFSVVMAVYNVEPFLREAVESLIAQDFGFEKIQLIMVDDGSTDGSGAICDEYAAQHPENVLVIHKENGGVSSARNEGLKYIQGRYVNFLDSDDKLSENVMTEVHNFFVKHEEETDVVAIPMFFFDGQTGPHQLNYKFEKGSRVIDLSKEYTMIQLSMSSTFCKHESLLDTQFDKNLVFAEDAKYLLKILMVKLALGVVTGDNISYLYRKRTGMELSALQTSAQDTRWFLPVQHFFHQEMIEYCMNTVGYVPKFVQFTLSYDLQWKIKIEKISPQIMTATECNSYRTTFANLLQYIDDDVLLAQKHIYPEHKLHMLGKKYGKNPYLIKYQNSMLLCYENSAVCQLSRCQTHFEFWEINNETCTIEGYTALFPFLTKRFELQLEVNGEIYPCRTIERNKVKYALGEPILYYCGFRASFPVIRKSERYAIRFLVVVDGEAVENKNFAFGPFFPMSSQYKNAYSIENGWKLSVTKQRLFITSCGFLGHMKCEFLFCRELWKANKLGGRKAVLARMAYYVLKYFKRKPIWLISDRIMRPDDNGEALFHFMRREHPKKIASYFVISKNSSDYKGLKKIGPVVDNLSLKHKILFLLADYNISSQADAITENPFLGYDDGVRDILSQKRNIFLQHGITKDDISGWVNRYQKNFYGFVTAAFPEYRSVLNGHYHYSEKEVWLTGFPRFDQLYHDEKKVVTIMPTWRKYLLKNQNNQTGMWSLIPQFDKSRFCCFYRDLLNHPRLLATANRFNYQLCFFPHPTLQPHLFAFRIGPAITVLGLDAKYREIYAHSDLVVTDYSSACFDFAYLRKPIIYSQFDAEEFFEGEHVYTKGYFDYERDGFGEVEYDLESTVDRIIEYMENGCQLKDKYRERIDKFFAFNDQNNCQRVYEEIIKLDKRD